jgi:hypothetical protein
MRNHLKQVERQVSLQEDRPANTDSFVIVFLFYLSFASPSAKDPFQELMGENKLYFQSNTSFKDL